VTHAPKLGQNYLRDEQACQRIVAALGDISQSTVVEIGPGHGVITELLVPRAQRVIAVELDHSLALSLRARYSPDQLTVVEQDVLQFDYAAAAAEAGVKLRVVGNLPYYITSPILLQLAEAHASIDLAVLMVQREVADRITAEPNSRDYGLLSVTTQLYGPVAPLFTLPPEAFSPPPQVHSTVFRWRFAPSFAELGLEPASFTTFLRQAFAQKRKTLANNLRAAGLTPESIAAALDQAAVPTQARAESLSIEALARLWRELNSALKELP
jgi:16S rRNA (adenine1518-N6/adenine1519-N6)-dimethyltransferase